MGRLRGVVRMLAQGFIRLATLLWRFLGIELFKVPAGFGMPPKARRF